jgi:hypothetical protein
VTLTYFNIIVKNARWGHSKKAKMGLGLDILSMPRCRMAYDVEHYASDHTFGEQRY